MELSQRVGRIGSGLKKYCGKHTVAAVSAVVISVGGAGGIAYALASGSSTPSLAAAPPSVSTAGASGSSTSTSQAGSSPTLVSRGLSRIRALVGRAVSAQIVVRTRAGAYKTVDLDRGTVTSLSASSIEVAPLDGSAPVTAAITLSTHEPKNVTISQGENVVLVSSGGDALIIRPMRTSAAGAGSGATPAPGSTSTTAA